MVNAKAKKAAPAVVNKKKVTKKDSEHDAGEESEEVESSANAPSVGELKK